MKIGDNIREIRESEKNLKRSYVAEKLHISTRAYSNIENNIADITINRLIEIAAIFDCAPQYILNYKQNKRNFLNHFHNNYGNKGTNIMYQGLQSQETELVQRLKDELIESEKKRIELLESLLKKNNINF